MGNTADNEFTPNDYKNEGLELADQLLKEKLFQSN